MMMSRHLRCTGLAHSDEVLLRSLVRLIAGHTQDAWEFAETDRADLLIAGRDADAQAAADGTSLVARVIDAEAAHSALALPHPFRARALIGLLDEASERLRAGIAAPPVIVHDGPMLAEHLYRLMDAATPLWIRFDVGGAALLHVHAGRGVFVAERIDAVIAAARRRDVIAVVEAETEVVVDAAARALSPLLWSMGLACRDALLPLATSDRIAVSRWPDFSRFPHGAEHMRMMARIARSPATAAELAAHTETSHEDATGFLNALLLSRCGEARAATMAAMATPPSRAVAPVRMPLAIRPHRGLIDRIRARLGLA